MLNFLLFLLLLSSSLATNLHDHGLSPKEQAQCVAVISAYLTNYTESSSECDGLMAAYRDGCGGSENEFSDDDVIISGDDDRTPIIPDHARFLKKHSNPRSDCCQKLMDTYHSRCNTKENGELTDQRLISIVMMLITCLFARSYVRSKNVTWLPEAAVCILVGMFCGFLIRYVFVGFSFEFDERLFLRVLLPPICFEAALSINKTEFRRLIGPILTFAIAGTLIR